ncbi:uricase-like isoform X1 [Lampetra planeri]
MSGREAAREGQQGGQQQQQRVAVLDAEYGKRGVRVLQLRRDPRGLHVVREVRARLLLSLASLADYERGDNAAVVPTDTLKNTVHALALANGIRCLEEFASQLCEHVMRTHGRVDRVRASLTETPWRRMNLDGKPHNHAFVLSPEVEFYCDVEAQQYGPPLVRSGLRGLRVLKTAQSGFEGFAREGFASLEESRDRLFCTEMEARWAFQRGLPLSARDYDEARCPADSLVDFITKSPKHSFTHALLKVHGKMLILRLMLLLLWSDSCSQLWLQGLVVHVVCVVYCENSVTVPMITVTLPSWLYFGDFKSFLVWTCLFIVVRSKTHDLNLSCLVVVVVV